MSKPAGPRRLGDALAASVAASAPATRLARVQAIWRRAVGPEIAAQAEPTGDRDGRIEISCRSSSWAHELDLLQDGIVAKVNAELAEPEVSALRFRADAGRLDPPRQEHP